MNRTTMIATLCLMLGCAAGAAVRQAAVAPAGAQVQGKKFQHLCQELTWEEVLGSKDLKPDLGAQGWELATFVSAEKKGFGGPTTRIVACFKREIGG